MVVQNLKHLSKPLSVLFIDDSPDDQLLLRESIKQFHFPIDLECLSSFPESGARYRIDAPDVVLLDLNLTESQGANTLEKGRTMFPRSAIVLMTGDARGADAIDCLSEGAQDFLVKGHYDESDLEKAIRFSHERNVQQLKLVDNSTALKLVLDSQPIGLLVIDPKGKIKTCNPAACKLLGLDSDQMVGKPSPISPGKKSPMEIDLGDGRTMEVHVAYPRGGNHDSLDTFMALSDATKRKKREQEDAEKGKLETVSRVCFGVAHEFNNLLAITRAKTDCLDNMSGSDPVWGGHIEDLKQACDRGSKLVKELMTYYGKSHSSDENLPVGEVLDDLENQLLDHCSPKHRLDIVCRSPHAKVEASSGHLSKILHRLVANACDAMPQGGNILILVDADDDAKSADGKKCLSFRVEDTGCGISKENESKIFEPFFTTKNARAGRGLGLSVVRNLLREDGGWIEIETEENVGSSFRFYLPVSELQPQETVDAPDPFEMEIVSDRKATLLVVDDEPIIRFSIQRLLESCNYNIITAENGADALSVLEEQANEIDLLLTDLNMPVMTGIDLANRASYMNERIRILVMSGFGASGVDEEWMKQKNAKFIAKPFSRDNLINIVQKSLSPSHPLQAGY